MTVITFVAGRHAPVVVRDALFVRALDMRCSRRPLYSGRFVPGYLRALERDVTAAEVTATIRPSDYVVAIVDTDRGISIRVRTATPPDDMLTELDFIPVREFLVKFRRDDADSAARFLRDLSELAERASATMAVAGDATHSIADIHDLSDELDGNLERIHPDFYRLDLYELVHKYYVL